MKQISEIGKIVRRKNIHDQNKQIFKKFFDN